MYRKDTRKRVSTDTTDYQLFFYVIPWTSIIGLISFALICFSSFCFHILSFITFILFTNNVHSISWNLLVAAEVSIQTIRDDRAVRHIFGRLKWTAVYHHHHVKRHVMQHETYLSTFDRANEMNWRCPIPFDGLRSASSFLSLSFQTFQQTRREILASQASFSDRFLSFWNKMYFIFWWFLN